MVEGTELATVSPRKLANAVAALEQSVCATKTEKLEVLISLTLSPVTTSGRGGRPAAVGYIRQIPSSLRKLAQKKYRAIFYTMLARMQQLAATCPNLYPLIVPNIAEIATLATLRFAS